MKDILAALHGILEKSSLSADEIMEQAFGVDENGNPRKSKWTFYKEVNPDDTSAKAGFIDMLRVMKVSGVFDALELAADYCGFALVSKDSIRPDKPNWLEEHLQDTGCLGEMARLMEDAAPSTEVYRAAKKAGREIMETAVSYEAGYRMNNLENKAGN